MVKITSVNSSTLRDATDTVIVAGKGIAPRQPIPRRPSPGRERLRKARDRQRPRRRPKFTPLRCSPTRGSPHPDYHALSGFRDCGSRPTTDGFLRSTECLVRHSATVSLSCALLKFTVRRRRCSMKLKMFFGALVLSVGMCTQSFGFELLDRMLGINAHRSHGGCSSSCCEASCCDPCEASCCDPCGNDSCCEASCCDPCASSCNEASCCDPCAGSCEASCCEPASCDSCGSSCDSCGSSCGNSCGSCCKKHCDLFSGLRGLFDCHKSCCKSSCCEPACCDPCGSSCCEASCCDPCGSSCCEASCSNPCGSSCGSSCGSCCHKRHCGFDLLGLFKCKKHHCRKSCCQTSCCNSCGNSCGSACGACGNGGGAAPTEAGSDSDEAAPMPPAPMPDSSASYRHSRRIHKVRAGSNLVVRN